MSLILVLTTGMSQSAVAERTDPAYLLWKADQTAFAEAKRKAELNGESWARPQFPVDNIKPAKAMCEQTWAERRALKETLDSGALSKDANPEFYPCQCIYDDFGDWARYNRVSGTTKFYMKGDLLVLEARMADFMKGNLDTDVDVWLKDEIFDTEISMDLSLSFLDQYRKYFTGCAVDADEAMDTYLTEYKPLIDIEKAKATKAKDSFDSLPQQFDSAVKQCFANGKSMVDTLAVLSNAKAAGPEYDEMIDTAYADCRCKYGAMIDQAFILQDIEGSSTDQYEVEKFLGKNQMKMQSKGNKVNQVEKQIDMNTLVDRLNYGETSVLVNTQSICN